MQAQLDSRPTPASGRPRYPHTSDGRYFVVRGRLWRLANPSLPAEVRNQLVHELMNARRAVRAAQDDRALLALARARVHEAKLALGERGPPWWQDGAPDYNRHKVENTPYAKWFAETTDDPVSEA